MKTRISIVVASFLACLSAASISQTQSLILPIPGNTNTDNPTKILNFIDLATLGCTYLPSHTFLINGQNGSPQDEGDLSESEPEMSLDNLYLFNEKYLGQRGQAGKKFSVRRLILTTSIFWLSTVAHGQSISAEGGQTLRPVQVYEFSTFFSLKTPIFENLNLDNNKQKSPYYQAFQLFQEGDLR